MAPYGNKMQRVKRNTMMSKNYAPIVHAVGSSIRVSHREFISDVISAPVAGAFTCWQIKINPSLSGVFPWLSGLARQYQQYEIKGMIFEYRPTCSDSLSTTNPALGDVIMTIDYNAATEPPENKFVMMNEEGVTSTKPSRGMIIPVECDRSQSPIKVLYTRGDTVPVGQDSRLYDFGSLNIASVGGLAASANLGELWVSYDIILLKPYSSTIQDEFAPTSVWHCTAWVGNRNLAPLAQKTLVFDNIGVTLPYDGSYMGGAIENTIAFPVNVSGKFLISISWEGTIANIVFPTSTYVNAVGIMLWMNRTRNYSSGPTNADASIKCILEMCLELTNPGYPSGVILGVGGTLPTLSTCDVVITRVAHSFNSV